MLHGQKIVFVIMIDNDSNMMPELKTRIWHHEKLVKKFLKTEICVMGRKTHEITGWKGPNSWILTKNKNLRREGIGTINNLDDIHLHTPGPKVYVLGGASLFKKMIKNIDELHMYVINNREGTIPFPKITMEDWKPLNYKNESIWSYGHLEKKRIDDTEEDEFLF